MPSSSAEYIERQMSIEQAVARTSDPETSHEAAASVTGLRAKQQAVLGLMIGREYIDEELVRVYHENHDLPEQSDSGIRTRRHELVTKGYVEWAGTFALNKGNRRARVWRTTEIG